MTNQNLPAPRRLQRDPNNKFIGGVCSGVANYLNMDPTLIRVLTVIITLFTGVPIIVYLVMLLVVPEAPLQPPPPTYLTGPQNYDSSFRPYDPSAAAGTQYQPAPGYQPAPAPDWNPNPPAGQQAPSSSDSNPKPAPQAGSPEDEVWGPTGAPWDQPPA